ncbi:MAG: hypothetical protein SF172_05170 [Burkholderiales bacterium]|nr:hypothetical protein [Burkholderiales bacterium]
MTVWQEMSMLFAQFLPAPSAAQSGATRPSQLWLWVAVFLVLGWLLNRWPAQTTMPLAAVHADRITAQADRSAVQGISQRFHFASPPADLGALISAARESSSAGSHYRALRALDFCARQARHMLEDHPEDALTDDRSADPRQLAALMQIRALCARDAGSATLDYYALAEEGLERPDPVLSLALRLERLSAAPHESSDLHDAGQRRELITRIFASREPALIDDLANELSLLSPRLSITVAGAEVEPAAHAALIAALRDLACGSAGCADDESLSRARLLRCAAVAQCDPLPDSAPASWERTRFLALLQFSGGRALDFSYRPSA